MSGVRYNSELTPIISGWRGNETQSSVKDILRQVSYLKTIDDCGDAENSILIFERMHDNDYSNYEYIKYELTRGLYPNHIFCKVSYSENAKSKRLNSVQISFKNRNTSIHSFRVIISDQVSSSVFMQSKSPMFGQKIQTPENKKGFTHYMVKVSQESHLPDDPNYNCVDYKEPGQLHQCLQNEFMKQAMAITNCTAPWMTDNENLWCQGNITVRRNKTLYQWGLFCDELLFRPTYGSCSVPCKTTKYSVKEFGFAEDNQKYGVYLTFEDTVDKTISEFQIGPTTLVARFGGIIGVGKNLLWIIILAFSVFGFCSSKIKKDNKEDAEAENLQNITTDTNPSKNYEI